MTIYSADGLHDGTPSWYGTEFDAFTKITALRVQYIEAGLGSVERIAKERCNTQADVLVTVPPFIHRAANGLLQAYTPAGADQIPASRQDPQHRFVPLVNNHMNFIYNAPTGGQAPTSFESLVDPKYRHKIQYSTPGQAGDGTAVMLEVIHAYGGKDKVFDFFKHLEDNNVGPSASTGKLTALVNRGEPMVANGDLQMNVAQMGELGATVMVYLSGWVTLLVGIFALTDQGKVFLAAAMTVRIIPATLAVLAILAALPARAARR